MPPSCICLSNLDRVVCASMWNWAVANNKHVEKVIEDLAKFAHNLQNEKEIEFKKETELRKPCLEHRRCGNNQKRILSLKKWTMINSKKDKRWTEKASIAESTVWINGKRGG